MTRNIRTGTKHGGVTGGGHPNSHKTNIIPGANPRGDGRVSCGHSATRPERYLKLKTPLYEGHLNLGRRVCEECYVEKVNDPESRWEDDGSYDDSSEEPTVSRAELENRQLRTVAQVLMNRLIARADWPVIQKLAKLALDAEEIINTGDINLGKLEQHVMDNDVQEFLVAMDHLNLLPDGKYGRLRALPTDYSVQSMLRWPGLGNLRGEYTQPENL